MRVLGIESSCDETAAAIVEDGTRLLSNVVNSQIAIHAQYGGVIPEVAARSHLEVVGAVIDEALTQAHLGWDDIDAIGVTYAPGLSGSLLIGTLAASTLAYLKDKPLYPIHHVEAHVYANFITEQALQSRSAASSLAHSLSSLQARSPQTDTAGALGSLLSERQSLQQGERAANSDVALQSRSLTKSVKTSAAPQGGREAVLADFGSEKANNMPQTSRSAASLVGSKSEVQAQGAETLPTKDGSRRGEQYENGLTSEDFGDEKANKDKLTPLPSLELPSSQPTFPMLALIVSGGHTQLVLFKNHGDYQLLGHTTDDAVGEAFDKVAKIIGLPYPGGPAISRTAQAGNPLAFTFPKAKLARPYDFSFSGLKTAVLRRVQAEVGVDFTFPSHELPERVSDQLRADIAASFEHIAIETLVDKTEKAFREFSPRSVVIAGGVAANQELRRQLRERLPLTIQYAPVQLCTDNAAMIATLTYYQAQKTTPTSPFELDIVPSLSMDKTAWNQATVVN